MTKIYFNQNNMKRIYFFFFFLFCFSNLARSEEAKKLNVLLLIADDLNCDVGSFGAPEMITPNIDKLAKRGLRFENAYCQYPWCCPSRSSFMTGRRPNVTQVLANPTPDDPMGYYFRLTLPKTVTMPQLFKNNGYFSARVGKIYHYGVPADIGTSSLDDYWSWDQVVNPRGRDREEQDKIFTLEPGQFGGTLSWLADSEGEDNDHSDGIGATEAIKFLEKFKKENRPFFLGMGFYRPHTPYVSPKHFFDLYPLSSIKLPQLSDDDKSRNPAVAYASFHEVQDRMSDDLRRQAIQGYHASTSFMDAQVGRVVDALDRLGLSKNTVIVFMSDHGYHLADHGLWQKQSLFNRSTHVPVIIVTPNSNVAGQVAKGDIELIDIYPTLASLCGLKAPTYLDGTDLSPMLGDPSVSVKKAAFSQLNRANGDEGYSVRSGKWRYTEWRTIKGKSLGNQLFDEDLDPNEKNNLANDPSFKSMCISLSDLIEPIRNQRPPANSGKRKSTPKIPHEN